MNVNSVNLAVRFLLEITGLVALALLGWSLGEGLLGILLAAGLPIVAATIWGLFAVPGDPSRSGNAPVPVSGLLRLFLELSFFALSAWSLYLLKYSTGAWIFGIIVCAHYIISYQRVYWLLRQ